MREVFLYTLNDPGSGKVRYVGKATNLKRRLYAHITSSRVEDTHRARWIRSLQGQGLRPVLALLDTVPEEIWQPVEAAYIQFFLERGCDLTNATSGGEGIPKGFCFSLRARENMAESQKGRKHSEATKLKMSQNHRGDKNPFFGKAHSKDIRDQIAAALTGRKRVFSKAHCEAIRRARMGGV